MKRKLLFLFFSLFVGVPLLAQNYRDVVFMKNGDTVEGLVIEQIPNSLLKIKITNGDTLVYHTADVEKIIKKEYDPFASAKQSKSRKIVRGCKGFVQMGGAFPIDRYSDGVFTIETSYGFQFNPYFYMGGGIGVNRHFRLPAITLPVFAHVRANFINNPTTPYFDLNIGYSVFDATGFYTNPGMGVHCRINSKCAVNIGLGYCLQMVKLGNYYDFCRGYGGCAYTPSNKALNGINIKLGFEFEKRRKNNISGEN